MRPSAASRAAMTPAVSGSSRQGPRPSLRISRGIRLSLRMSRRVRIAMMRCPSGVMRVSDRLSKAKTPVSMSATLRAMAHLLSVAQERRTRGRRRR